MAELEPAREVHHITMQPGEVAEFETRVPHWFGPTRDLGREGGRIHLRVAPRRESATG